MAHIMANKTQSGRVTYSVRWRDAGKYRQRTVGSKRDAERLAAQISNEVSAGLPTRQYSRTTKTVDDAWEEVRVADRNKRRKPTTLSRYDQLYRHRVAPTFGAHRVNTLTTAQIDKWIADLLATGLSYASVQKAFLLLSKAMKMATQRGWIVQNPCLGVALSSPRAAGIVPHEMEFLTPAQVERLANAIDTPPYDLLVRVAAYMGLRAGELAGLQIRDVNLLRRTISVTRTVYYVDGEWITDTPKSQRSRRVVPILHEPLLADLGAFLDQHPRRDEPTAPLWPGRNYSRSLDYTRQFNHKAFYGHTFRPAVIAAGLPERLRFHDLRHTYASMLLEAGVELHKISRWMGHENLATTDTIYSHIYPSDYADESAVFAAYVRRVDPARGERPMASLPTVQ